MAVIRRNLALERAMDPGLESPLPPFTDQCYGLGMYFEKEIGLEFYKVRDCQLHTACNNKSLEPGFEGISDPFACISCSLSRRWAKIPNKEENLC